MDLDGKFTCDICGNSVSLYLKNIHEAKCRIEQGLKNSQINKNEQKDYNLPDKSISNNLNSYSTPEYILDDNDNFKSIMERIRKRKESLLTNFNRETDLSKIKTQNIYQNENNIHDNKIADKISTEVKQIDNTINNQVHFDDKFDESSLIIENKNESNCVLNEKLADELEFGNLTEVKFNEIETNRADIDNDEKCIQIEVENEKCTHEDKNNYKYKNQEKNSDNDKDINADNNSENGKNINEDKNFENNKIPQVNLEENEEISENEFDKEINDSIVQGSMRLFSDNSKIKEEVKFTKLDNPELNKQNYIREPLSNINISIMNNKNNISGISNIPNTTTPSANIKQTSTPKNISEDFLQKIEETDLEKQKEVKQTLEEIQLIEKSLKLDERLMHDKWQIRKNAYKEISDMISVVCQNENIEDKDTEAAQLLETFFPWLKYFISDTNITALAEGLNTFYTFMKYAIDNFKNKMLMEFFDELDKITTLNKSNINETCIKIITLYLNNKKMANSTFNELIRKLNATNSKMLQLIQRIFLEIINSVNSNSNSTSTLNENFIKVILEKSILYYSASLNSKNIEKKKIFAKLIQEIYSIIQDEYEVIKKNVFATNHKDLEKVIKSVKKQNIPNGKKIILYNDTYNILSNENNLKIREKTRSKSPKNKKSSTIVHEIDESHHVSTPVEVSDLRNLIPENFFEIPYTPQFNIKKEILEKTNKLLSNLVNVKDKEKDYREILSNLNHAIDDSNVLVHSEAIKCLSHLARLLKMNINQSKLKLLLHSCFDKFKDKKSLVKIELYNLFDSLIINYCFQLDYFINFILHFVVNQKNPIIKQSLLEYIKRIFSNKDENSISIERETENNKELATVINGNTLETSQYVNFTKLLADIILAESQSNIKDVCTDLILIFKQQIPPQIFESKFKKMLDSLPSYRKNIVITGKSNYNSNEVSEKEYKANLRRIKSNLSIRTNNVTSHSRDTKRKLDTSAYETNNNKLNMSKDKSLSRTRTNSTKNNLNKMVSEKKFDIKKLNNRNANVSNSKLNDSMNEKGKDLKRELVNKKKEVIEKLKNNNKINSIDFNQKDNPLNTSNIGNTNHNIKDNNIKRILINKINEEETEKKRNIKNTTHTIEENKEMSDSQRTNGTNISVLEKRMESAIEHIYSLGITQLLEYIKKVIKDFLIFIKNVTTKNLKEDLESHFKVIIKILSKIWERIKQLQKNRDSIPEEIFIQTIKIIIVAPCFIDADEHGKGRIYYENLLPFMEFMRKLVNNDEKLFNYYLDISNKFINYEKKTTSFLENVNPRASFGLLLEYFTANEHNPFDLISMNAIKSLRELVIKSPFLSEFEKHAYLNNSEFQECHYNNDNDKELNHKELDVDNIEDETDTDNRENHNYNNIKLESSLIQNIRSEREVNSVQNESYQYQIERNDNFSNQFETEINKMNDGVWQKKLIETEANLKKQMEENEILKEQLNTMNKKNSDNEELGQYQSSNTGNISSLISNIPDNQHNNYNVNEDILDIKDKIKQKVRKLDLTIQRLGSKIDPNKIEIKNSGMMVYNDKNNSVIPEQISSDAYNIKTNQTESTKINLNTSMNNNSNAKIENSIKSKPIRSLEDFFEEEKQNFLKEEMNNQNKNEENYYNNNFNKKNDNYNPLNRITNEPSYQNILYREENSSSNNYKNLILKIPSNLLDNNVSEIALYVKLESIYKKLSVNYKLEFINELKIVLENNSLLKASSFNCLLQLFEFLLALLIHEIILKNSITQSGNNQEVFQPILNIQEIIENIIKNKEITEIIKVLIYLLKKFLPKDFKYTIDKDGLVFLKTISYLIKYSLEIKEKAKVEFKTYDLLQEINELLVSYPPSNFRKDIPNYELLNRIYQQLKLLTDISTQDNIQQARVFYENTKKRNKECYNADFMQYLVSIINQ